MSGIVFFENRGKVLKPLRYRCFSGCCPDCGDCHHGMTCERKLIGTANTEKLRQAVVDLLKESS